MTQEPRKFVVHEDVVKALKHTLKACLDGRASMVDIRIILHDFETDLCLLDEKKCPFIEECAFARGDSATCMKDGGGEYCGVYREQLKKGQEKEKDDKKR